MAVHAGARRSKIRQLRFASASAFAAAFRRTLGMSPNVYRQRRRSGEVTQPDPARFG